jgi:putative hemolysin
LGPIQKIIKKMKSDELTIQEATEKEILDMVEAGRTSGALRGPEAIMVKNIFDLDEKSVKDIMVHRSDVVGIDGNEMLSEVIDAFIQGSYSRFPVFIGSIDNIIGIVHIKDILKYARENDSLSKKIRDINGLIRPAESVPETHGVYTLFTTMKLDKTHMAIVVDEYGQTSGIVTMENILEEIVGNIQDEHDNEETQIRLQRDDTFICAGLAPLEEVGEKLGIEFPDDGYETLNGFMTDRLGHVPKTGEDFETEFAGYRFRIAYVKGRVIQSVRCTRLPKEEAEPVDPGPVAPGTHSKNSERKNL